MNTLKRIDKWKVIGIEEIMNFRFHHLSSLHQQMMKLISEILKESEKKCLIGSQKE